MEFEAQEGVRLLALMGAGAVFALVGLYLLIRPKPENGTAKIELFGIKFESSSAGVLVFLIGAVFLAIPLFVPEKPADTDPGAPPEVPDSADAITPPLRPGTGTVTGPIAAVMPEPARPQPPVMVATIDEAEPNNRVARATRIALGQVVRGRVDNKDDIDWFEMPVPAGGLAAAEIRARHVAGHALQLDAYTAREEPLGALKFANGASYLPLGDVTGDQLYLRVTDTIGLSGSYELSVLPSGQN
jgi:hypothetical protein